MINNYSCNSNFFKYLFLFIYLFGCTGMQVLVAACGIFDLCCGMQDLQLRHGGSSSLARDGTQAPYIQS